MRTTVTLEPEAIDLVRTAMMDRQASFKEVVNQAIVDSLSPIEARPFHTPTHDFGASPDMTKALQIAADLEDEAIIAQMGLRDETR